VGKIQFAVVLLEPGDLIRTYDYDLNENVYNLVVGRKSRAIDTIYVVLDVRGELREELFLSGVKIVWANRRST
jgi:hypothetical protein